MTPMQSLRSFENDVDRRIAALQIFDLPARPLLTGLHRLIFEVRNAASLGQTPRPGMAERIGTRIGSLLPLIAGRPGEPSTGTVLECLRDFTDADPDGDQLGALLEYMRFSETMPEVHKGWYDVEEEGDAFVLRHATERFARFEAEDVVRSELSIVTPLAGFREAEPELAKLVDMAPELDRDLLLRLLQRKLSRLPFGDTMPNLVTEDGMRRIFGFSYGIFYRIRSAVLAYAEFCADMAQALALRDVRGGLAGLSGRTLEWVSVSHRAPEFIGLIAGLSASEKSQVERFLELLTVDFRHSPARHHGRDGFFPPFARFESGFVFSPEMVLTQTHLRNLIGSYAEEQREIARRAKEREKKDKTTLSGVRGRPRRHVNPFDAHVSRDFEKVLVGQAIELLENSAAWKTRPSVKFDNAGRKGEIDLVVSGPAGPVLLLQAKGMLPPHGARLTRNLADQIRIGLDQVRNFRALPEAVQTGIVSKAVERKVGHGDIRHGLLARSCFGSMDVVHPDAELLLITIPVLSLALGRMREDGETPDVDALGARVMEVERDLFDASGVAYGDGEYEILGRRVVQPLLGFDDEVVARFRRKAWSDSEIMDPDRRRRRRPGANSPTRRRGSSRTGG